jgi:hypothetical protein
MAVIVANKQFVVDWVNREIRELSNLHDESNDHMIQAYDDALTEYEQSGNAAKLIKVLEEDRSFAAMPPFEREAKAAEAEKKVIELHIETFDAILEFLRA